MFLRRVSLAALLALVVLFATVPAQEPPRVSPSLFSEMRWRNIGPHRGSRTVAAAGHRRQPHTFYMAAVNGGVWKTTDAGRTWVPIFDDQPTGSIGSIAVAPSDPNVIYAGSGEGLHRPDLSTGDGLYKSADAGRTWTRLGLYDAQQIPRIDVDPANPNRAFVAVLGHPYGPNEERGIFRSLDGGRTFKKVLYKDENTGGNDVDIDPVNPNVVFATLWEERQGPWRTPSGPALAAASSNRPTEAPPGGRSRKDCRPSCRPTSRSRRPIIDGCMPPSRTSTSQARAPTGAPRASSAATMQARRGRVSPRTRGRPGASEAAICPCQSRIRSSWTR
jgi:hypothetical protein